MATVRLTVGQALVRFLPPGQRCQAAADPRLLRHSGHGNVAVGQALLEAHVTGSADLPYYLACNEQAMVRAVGFARMRNRRRRWPAPRRSAPARRTWSLGRRWPPSTVRCCCCPATTSPPGRPARCSRSRRTRGPSRCRSTTRSSRCRGTGIDQPARAVPSALLAAMRVLTDPPRPARSPWPCRRTQAEAHDRPEELFAERVWHVARPMFGAGRAPGRGRAEVRPAAADRSMAA